MAEVAGDEIKIVVSLDDKPIGKKIDGLVNRIEKIGDAAEKTGEATREGFKRITEGADDAKDAVDKIATVTAKAHPMLDRLADSAMKAGEAFGGKLVDGAKTLGKALLKLSVAPLIAPLKAVTGAFSKFGSAVSRLFSKIKSVIMYRAIRSAIRMVTDGFKEGTANAYQWSKAMGGQFAASMDQLATSSLYLKNSLGALVTPLINAVAPAIDYIVDKFVDLLNVASQVIALLTGASAWTKAVKYPKEYAAAADGAAGSAGKLAKAMTTILAIDELNPLNGDKGSGGGGGGGGGSALDYSSMFTEQTIDVRESLGDMFQPFVDAWETKGQGVIESWHNALSGIQAAVSAVSSSFAEVWTNGTGTETIEHILGILTGILDTIGNIGKKFAEGWNTDNLGTQIIQNLWNILNNILGLWDRIANATATWASNLNFVPILTSFNNLTAALSHLSEVVTGVLGDAWEKVILPLGKWLLESGLPAVIDLIAMAIETAATNLQILVDTLEKLKKMTLPQWLQGLFGGTLASGGSLTDVPQAAAGATLGMRFSITGIQDDIPENEKTITGMVADFVKRTLGEKVKKPVSNLVADLTKRTLGSKVTADVSNLTGSITERKVGKKVTATIDGLTAELADRTFSKTFSNVIQSKAEFTQKSSTGIPGYDSSSNSVKFPSYADFNGWAFSGLSGYDPKSGLVKFPSYANFGAWGYSELSGYHSSNSRLWFPSYAYFEDYDTKFNRIKMPIEITAAYRPDGVRIDMWKAKGGAYYNGAWHNIPQYATGGLPDHGTLFAAGEAGAEVVGHIGGRTEVLNQSQLASTMAAATQMGMASQNAILGQLLAVGQQILENQGDIRAYIPAGEVVTGLQRNNRRDGRALVPMGV